MIKTQENSKTGENTAKISLQDCLACSGCVTSAETVLLQQHSVDEFMKLFTDGNEVHIAVSPQSLSSLTNYFATESDHDTFEKLSAIFKMIGAKEVYDLSWYNELSLQLSYLEFKDRFLASAKYNTDQLKSVKKGIKWN